MEMAQAIQCLQKRWFRLLATVTLTVLTTKTILNFPNNNNIIGGEFVDQRSRSITIIIIKRSNNDQFSTIVNTS